MAIQHMIPDQMVKQPGFKNVEFAFQIEKHHGCTLPGLSQYEDQHSSPNITVNINYVGMMINYSKNMNEVS